MKESLRNSIKVLTRVYYDYQRERIALDGRLGIKKDGKIKKKVPERDMSILLEIKKRREEVFAVEEETKKALCKEIHKHPLWNNFFIDAKGCAETMAAVLISEIDINIATNVSKIWSFAGLAPGKDKKEKGKKCPFNQFLRSRLCGVLGPCFLKSNSPYREYYDNMKTRLESQNWGMKSKNPSDKTRPKAFHQHRAANRYMIKMFLIDLYIAWRTIEGLPVRDLYKEEYLGKKHN